MTEVDDVRRLVDRVAATEGRLTEDLVAEISGIALSEVSIFSPSARQFEGVSSEGLFGEVSFRRGIRPGDPGIQILVVRPTQTPQLTWHDFREAFDFRNFLNIDMNPNIQPEGVDSYILPLGERKLWLSFTHVSEIFTAVAVHEDIVGG